MNTSAERTAQELRICGWVWPYQTEDNHRPRNVRRLFRAIKVQTLRPMQQWLDQIEVCDSQFARRVCKLIPAQCPFERDITLGTYKVAHIPPLCKLNPLYDQLVGLRFRALCYLADECGEDISPYC